METVQFLRLDRIKTNPQLVKLLPQDIALRYHALPVATNGSRITVAMGSPEDSAATNAVAALIGVPICLIQADPNEIDQCLSEIWPQIRIPPFRVLVWSSIPNMDPALKSYSQALTDLLQAECREVDFTWGGAKSFDGFIHEIEQIHPDLIVFQIQSPPLMKRLLIDFAVNKLIERIPTSILIVKQPSWPLERILLVLRDGIDQDEAVVDWVIRLAQRSHAAVTVLPLLPPVPQMYGPLIRHSLPSLLRSNDPLGIKMREIARRLKTEHVDGIFKIRDGDPMEQIQCELSDRKTDLMVIDAEPRNHVWRWLIGEVVNNIHAWCDRPLLIVNKKWERITT
jgi:nucleotide-binding universal stress UspA family protein